MNLGYLTNNKKSSLISVFTILLTPQKRLMECQDSTVKKMVKLKIRI